MTLSDIKVGDYLYIPISWKNNKVLEYHILLVGQIDIINKSLHTVRRLYFDVDYSGRSYYKAFGENFSLRGDEFFRHATNEEIVWLNTCHTTGIYQKPFYPRKIYEEELNKLIEIGINNLTIYGI